MIQLKTSFLFFGLLLLAACSSSADSSETKAIKHDIANVNTSEIGNTFSIEKPCLVFLLPDSLEMNKMKADDSMSFYAVMDDFSFYLAQASMLADSMSIPSFPTDKRMIDFTTTNNKHILIDRLKIKEGEPSWGVYLFNGIDTPLLQSTIDINRPLLDNFFKH